MRIVLDPGHCGTPDPGAVGPSGLRESDIALEIAQYAKNQFEGQGYEVILTRESQDDPSTDDLSVRTSIANDAGADLFISIHCNSAEDPQAHGIETFHYYGSEQGNKFAAAVQNELVYSMQLANRGVKEAGYYVIKYTNMPAILVETAFISNPEEEQILADMTKQQLFAQAIVNGVLVYLRG